jgi:CO dehydrogenase/acetyl-CoA synthase epsilon subunit
MDEKIPELQKKIMEESDLVQAKIKEIERDWNTNKPVEASKSPEDASPSIKKAIKSLIVLGSQIDKTKEELVRVCKAKELLNLELSDSNYLDILQED